MLVTRFLLASASVVALPAADLVAQPATETRLLRQPTLSATHIAFTYGADVWVVPREGGDARRLTSTPAVERDPQFSPDGQWIAFTSTRSGGPAVWVVPAAGGDARRLTWSPAGEVARTLSSSTSRWQARHCSSRAVSMAGLKWIGS